MKQRIKEWLNIRVGTEQPKDAMEAHQLAKHYYHVARRQKMFGTDCTENMTLAKKFFEQYKELKKSGDPSDNDSLEEVDIDNEIDNFSEDINEAGYKRPAVAARNRDIARKSSKLRGRESVSSKTTTMFKKRHGGKTVANRPGTEGVPRSTGAKGDKRALGGQGAILQDLHNMPEDEFRRKHGKSKSAARTALRNESASPEQVKKWEDRSKEVSKEIAKSPMRKAQAAKMKKDFPQATQKYSPTNEDHLRENSISVSMHSSGTKYKVHGVHKSIKGRIKPGEHLSDTHIDDLRDSGVKIRHVKPPKPTVKEDDEGWYAHREIHGDKGVSKSDWKKGVRMNRQGKKVQMQTGASARRSADLERHAHSRDRAGKKIVAKEQGQTSSIGTPLKKKRAWNPKTHKLIVKKPGGGVKVVPKSHPGMEAESVNEGGMKRMATQDAERERLGAKKVKGTGMKTFKKKPTQEYGVEKERKLAAKGDRYEQKEHAPEVVEYTPYAYDYNRKAWEESLAEVNRYKGRSGHRVTKPEKEEPEHIIMQMRKVQSLKKNHQGVDFHDGNKVKINPGHAAQVINRHDKAKPAEKERIARTAAHSHDGLKHVASGKDIDDSSPGAPKKPLFKAAARREPLRRVRHPDDE